ncbi:MAG: sigma-70 family RNA polymerase sigma factor [Blastocatellia bacterium]|nr:sigma-70 family RNA polymerase sigma factor [Blastocatellia bacterium]
MSQMSAENITQLLEQWSDGNSGALDQLMPLVYDELRRLASSYLHRQPYHRTMQPTMLVHEAYLRLVQQKEVSWQGRAQFFGLAATLMRRILVDHTREKLAEKRGGGEFQISMGEAEQIGRGADVDLIALEDALTTLARLNPEHARVVELRYFGGLTIEETAIVLGVSHATVERAWSMARVWLRRELSR